jgi:MinD superfamily P-loop ATPase
MRVAVASGKGGTGKTIVSTSLAWLLAQQGHRVRYVDADVEEPNGHLLLGPTIEQSRRYAARVPALRGSSCSGCGECQRSCEFHAILALPDRVMVLPELCHSCGACLLACPDDALEEVPRETGTIEAGRSGRDPVVWFHAATLDVGQPRATPLISGLLEGVPDDELVLIDSPPGTSCSAMAAVGAAERVLLVTEPTPFGLHDLKLAVEMARALGRTPQVVLNRADLGNHEVRRYVETEGLELLAEIPFSQEVAVAYAQGRIAAEASDTFRQQLEPVAERIVQGRAP